jgi:hypothetical protein
MLLGWIAMFAMGGAGLGAELKVAENAPPRDVADSIRTRLQTKSLQLTAGGKTICEFWLVAETPLQSKPASPGKSLDAVKPATLLGVVSVPQARRDYRDDELAAGVYTMRLAAQPQDGNHLGTAEYPWFAVLVPAKSDTGPDAITSYKMLVETSSKPTATGHPVILCLWPAGSNPGNAPKINEPTAGHQSVQVKIAGKTAAGEAAELPFEIVFEGKRKE